jgi:hypothetical protein
MFHEKIKVVNKYAHEATSDDIYIGRGSVFGNPYSHLESEHPTVLCRDREESLEKYNEWFTGVVTGCGCKHKSLHQKLREIIVKLRMGEEVNLVCFCKPKACHGDTIRNYILEQL